MRNLDEEIDRTCTFIEDSIARTKSDGVIIALSGGLDSAVVAALSGRAISKENVHCYFLRYRRSALETDRKHSVALCHKFGLPYAENRLVTKSTKASSESRNYFEPQSVLSVNNNYVNVFIGNIDALMRSRYLYKKASEYNSLVLGALNRSEWSIGYFTQFEKNGVDIQPILHLYKTEVFEIAKRIGVPDEIITRVPSSDIWCGRIDKRLTYQKIDKVLIKLDKKDLDFHECNIADVPDDEVSKCLEIVRRARQKNKGVFPPSIHE